MQTPNIFDKNIFYILSTAQKLLSLYVVLGLILAFLLLLIIRILIFPMVKKNISSNSFLRPYKFLFLSIFCIGLIMVGYNYKQDLQFAKVAQETAIFNSGLYEQRAEGDLISYNAEQLGRLAKEDHNWISDAKPPQVQFKNEKLALLSGYLKESRAQETEEILNPKPEPAAQ